VETHTTLIEVTIQAQIPGLPAKIQSEFNIAIILIRHDLGVVARIADRVAVMYAGELVEIAPTTDLFRQPLHPYTEGLMHCVPVPGNTTPGTKLGAIPGTVPVHIGDRHECRLLKRCPSAFAGTACSSEAW